MFLAYAMCLLLQHNNLLDISWTLHAKKLHAPLNETLVFLQGFSQSLKLHNSSVKLEITYSANPVSSVRHEADTQTPTLETERLEQT